MCADESERQRTSLGAELRKLTRYARERGPRGKLGVKGSSSSRRDGTLACRVRDDLGRHAKAGEEWQPRNQKPAADSEAGKVTVLHGSGHGADIDPQEVGSICNRHDGGAAPAEFVEIHISPLRSAMA